MRIATVQLENMPGSPYSQSRHFGMDPEGQKLTDKNGRTIEDGNAHEHRVWRLRCHVNQDGNIFIPPMSFKNALSEAARYMAMQIPGKGKITYTKHFEAGVMCMDPLVLPITRDAVDGDWLFVPSDGKRGGGKRVPKCFPVIKQWGGLMIFYVIDDVITTDVFEMTLRTAGSLIGIGRFRPRNNGFFGRFVVKSIKWSELADTVAA